MGGSTSANRAAGRASVSLVVLDVQIDSQLGLSIALLYVPYRPLPTCKAREGQFVPVGNMLGDEHERSRNPCFPCPMVSIVSSASEFHMPQQFCK